MCVRDWGKDTQREGRGSGWRERERDAVARESMWGEIISHTEQREMGRMESDGDHVANAHLF